MTKISFHNLRIEGSHSIVLTEEGMALTKIINFGGLSS